MPPLNPVVSQQYISDIPFGYAYGALLLDRKKFSRLPGPYQPMIKETAEKHFSLLITDTRKSNHDSRQVLLDNGVTISPPDPKDIQELHSMRDETIQRMQDTAFSPKIYKETMRLLEEYRKQNP